MASVVVVLVVELCRLVINAQECSAALVNNGRKFQLLGVKVK